MIGLLANPSLAGKTVVLLEARRGTELARIVESYGGTPRHAPAMREEPIDSPADVARFLDALAAVPPNLVIFQTGVGAAALDDAITALGRTAEWRTLLEKATVAVRGPKPVAALRERGVRVDVRTAEPHTTAELLAALADQELRDKTVALQHHGERNGELVDFLRARGARVVDVELYRWALPADTGPLEQLIRDLPDGVDAVVVTSQAQVRNLFALAERLGRAGDLPALLAQTTVAAVGPIAAAALTERGVRVDVQPAHPKMGALVRELAERTA